MSHHVIIWELARWRKTHRTNNKNPETDISVQAENQKSKKPTSRKVLPLLKSWWLQTEPSASGSSHLYSPLVLELNTCDSLVQRLKVWATTTWTCFALILYSLGWSWIHRHPSASVSQILGLKVYDTTAWPLVT